MHFPDGNFNIAHQPNVDELSVTGHVYTRPHTSDDIDPLTTLPNRNALDQTLAEYLEQSPGNFGVLYLDGDSLKHINDTQGHDAGDEYLRNMAAGLGDAIQNGTIDAAFRVGGDEFIALLRGTSDPTTLPDTFTSLKDTFPSLRNVSMGGAIHEYGQSPQDVIKAADAAMYADKELRRQSQQKARLEALPFRKRMAARLGSRLMSYSGLARS